MLKPDGRPDQLVLDSLDSPSLYNTTERGRRTRDLLCRFKTCDKTESAMWLAFNTLSWNDVAFLMGAFGVDTDFALFRTLCREYKVRVA